MGDMTFESAALESAAAFKAGNYDEANRLLRVAREIVGDKARVVQMGDGALQVVPNE